MPNAGVLIKGTGYYLPEYILTNDDLSKKVDTSDEWIRTRTGIRQRHIASEKEACSDLALQAAKKALTSARLQPSDIDILIVATVTPDMLFPSTAAILQAKLGANAIMSFDVNAACSGFLYALEVARHLLQNKYYRYALVVGSEKLSSVVDWNDRTTCILFGDGAGAFILEKTDASNGGILDGALWADGSNPDVLCMPAGGSLRPATLETVQAHLHFISMNGREVFKAAVRLMAKAIEILLERNCLDKDDIACFVPHQANLRIIQSLAQLIGVSMERMFCNLAKIGNISAASIPVAFAQAEAIGSFHKGDYIILVAFGGGLTWGATLIRYTA